MLELAVRRRLSDADLARMLRIAPARAAARRERALERLGAELGVSGQEACSQLQELTDGQWDGQAAASPPASAVAPAPARPVWLRPIAIGVIVLVLVLAGVALATLGGSGPSHRATRASTSSTPVSSPGQHAATAPGVPAPGGTASLGGPPGHPRIRLALRGLPRQAGRYEAWLYTTIIGARPLGAVRAPGGVLTVPLPRDAARFHYLDVSFQPAGSAAEHSGLSVLRVPFAALRRGRPAPLRPPNA